MTQPPPRSTLFPYTTLFRSLDRVLQVAELADPFDARAGRQLHLLGDLLLRLLDRSEEHTSELQSRLHLVCRLLLEKKKTVADDVANPIRGVARRGQNPAVIV